MSSTRFTRKRKFKMDPEEKSRINKKKLIALSAYSIFGSNKNFPSILFKIKLG